MPIPINLTPSTAITLTAGTIVQQVDDSGVTYNVYYKYTNSSSVDEVISIGIWGDLGGGGYRPLSFFYADLALTEVVGGTSTNGSYIVPIPVGFTYWFEILHEVGDFVPSNLNIEFFVGPAALASAGNIFIRAASMDQSQIDAGLTGLYAGIIDVATEAIIGYKPQFITGESGDIFTTSGKTLFADEAGSGPNGAGPGAGDYYIYIFDTDFNFDSPGFIFNSLFGHPVTRLHKPSQKIYIASKNGSSPFTFITVEPDETLGTLTTVPAAGNAVQAIAVNNAETILYVAPFNGKIRRWDLVGLAYLSDLAATVTNYRVTDILVLDDDTIVACYYKSSSTRDCKVIHYDTAGVVLNTYTFSFPATLTEVDPRLGWSSDAVVSFWLLNHLSSGYGLIKKIKVSDGTELESFLIPDGKQQLIEQADPPIPYTSDSCPIIELAAGETPPASSGTIIVNKVTNPVGLTQQFIFSAGGGLSPSSFTLEGDGDSQTFLLVPAGSGYSIVETANPLYDTDYVVSNASPINNISVAEDEVVVVTVTNTQLSSIGSGIYKIIPGAGKRNDTLWNADFSGTTDVKIPRPFGSSGLIGS